MKTNAAPFLLMTFLAASGPANSQESPAPVPPPAPTTADAPPPQQLRRPLGLESFIGLFGGGVTVADTRVSATSQCFFCSPVSAEKNVSFDRGSTAGLRAGFWGPGDFIYAGLGLELAHTAIRADSVNIRYDSLTFTPMLRLPLFRTAAMRGGHVNLYTGLLVSRTIYGKMSVGFPELPRTVSGNVDGRGLGVLFGASLRYARLALNAEYRSAGMNLTFSDLGDRGSAKLSGKQTLFGLSCLF